MKNQFPLLSKIYLCEFLSAMFFWLAGWLMFTPPWDFFPVGKYLLLGTMMTALLILVMVFLIKPSEKMDDRARNNLYRSAFLVFTLFVPLLVVAAVLLLVFGQITIQAHHLLFVLAALLSIHAIAFFVNERRGSW